MFNKTFAILFKNFIFYIKYANRYKIKYKIKYKKYINFFDIPICLHTIIFQH
jgi:hypothetical protein